MKETPRIEVVGFGNCIWRAYLIVGRTTHRLHNSKGREDYLDKREAVRIGKWFAAQLGNLPVYVDGEKVEG